MKVNVPKRLLSDLAPLTMIPAEFRSNSCRLTDIFLLAFILVLAFFPVAYASGASAQPRDDVQLIPDALISLGSENSDNQPAYAIVVEKDTQTVMVYEHKDSFSLKFSSVCSTGEVRGKKEKSGDRKTPEGIYFATKAFSKRELSPIYGQAAFVMDYPNLVDRKSNRNGNNIWLHGTNKRIKPRDSNGCVAMNNDDLEMVSKCIELNRTPIIIEKKLNLVKPESQLGDYKSLIGFLETWKTAFVSGDRAQFAACYKEPSEDQDALWQAWDEIRTTWKEAQIPFGMTMKSVSLLKTNPYVVALFDEVIQLDRHVSSVGRKKLFVNREGDTWKIVAEVYQPAGSNPEPTKPMVAALARLDRLQKEYKDIAEVLATWADAWSHKDVARYRACYAENFYARGMDLRAWIRHKEKLNKRYGTIQVSVENLQVRQHSDRSTATFLQRYHSSGHQSVGMKSLRLKRIGGTWKIYRETWHRNPK